MFAHERYDQFLAHSGTSFSRTFHLAQNCMGSLFLFDLFSIELGIWGHNSYGSLNLFAFDGVLGVLAFSSAIANCIS
jgi:hypothetical protein